VREYISGIFKSIVNKVSAHDTLSASRVKTFLDDVFRKAERKSKSDTSDITHDFEYRRASLPLVEPKEKTVHFEIVRNDTIEEDVIGENYQATKSINKSSKNQLKIVEYEGGVLEGSVIKEEMDGRASKEQSSISERQYTEKSKPSLKLTSNSVEEDESVRDEEASIQEDFVQAERGEVYEESSPGGLSFQPDRRTFGRSNIDSIEKKDTTGRANLDSIEEKDQNYIIFTQESKKSKSSKGVSEKGYIRIEEKESPFKKLHDDPLEDAYKILNLRNLDELDVNDESKVHQNSNVTSKQVSHKKVYGHYRSNSQDLVIKTLTNRYTQTPQGYPRV
jgi:hypothetical protein